MLRYAWLDGLPALNRDLLPGDFAVACRNSNVTKIIFVESGCLPAQNLAELDWIARLAKGEPRLKGIIAQASLERGALVRPDLDALGLYSMVKGVRRNLQEESDPDFCLRANFINGTRLLANAGFAFDLCIRADQLPAVSELVRRVPEVSFVLDHLGKPDVRGSKREPWATGLKMLASSPNVCCKVSGLTTEADWTHWHLDDLKFYFAWAVECFGFDRLLFGSDWPVATLATDYERWIDTVAALASAATESERIKLFQTNAERTYHV